MVTDKYNTDYNYSKSKEECLDELMEEEQDKFTPTFLWHIKGKCDRITNASKMTQESAQLLEISHIIQTCVLR